MLDTHLGNLRAARMAAGKAGAMVDMSAEPKAAMLVNDWAANLAGCWVVSMAGSLVTH